MLDGLSKGPAQDGQQRLRFGNFDIINDSKGQPLLLGQGTFGRTYKACHRFLDTVVALKIINERYAADAGVRQRFLIEARAVAKLSHPHIARLHDFGEMDGVLHYAMEYCGGGDLATFAERNGAGDVASVIEIGQQIAGALDCAHSAGFIHRDLKPSNIMLTEAGGPLFTKLIDFGLVRASVPGAARSFVDDDAGGSLDGPRFLGTPLFASPEQLREESVDFRTDVFALGISLWYLLLGRAPEVGSSAQIAASRLSPESYAARLPADTPAPLREVLARLIEKDRDNRFASAAEVQRALNECAAALGLTPALSSTDGRQGYQDAAASQERFRPKASEPAAIETVDGSLTGAFKIVTRAHQDFTGSNYVAEPAGAPGPKVFLHVLPETLVENTALFELFRIHVAQLMDLALPEVLAPKGVRVYSDEVALILENTGGLELNAFLRARPPISLAEARPLLEAIAGVCDRLSAAGAPGVQLAAGRIFLDWESAATSSEPASVEARPLSTARPRLFPRLLAVSEAPDLARAGGVDDITATMTTDTLVDPTRADNHPEHFAILVYRIVSGRNCPVTASVSPQAYVPVSALTEQGNRILSLVIAKQLEYPSCGEMFRELLEAEGLAVREAERSSARSTARPASTTSSAPPRRVSDQPGSASKSATASTSSPRASSLAPPRVVPAVPSTGGAAGRTAAPPLVPDELQTRPPRTRLFIVAGVAVAVLSAGAAVLLLKPSPKVAEIRTTPTPQPTIAPTATPISTPATPTPPPVIDRKELLRTAVTEAEKLESTARGLPAVEAYVRIQKNFPESNVGKIRLELLLAKLISGGLTDEEFLRFREPVTEAANLEVLNAMEMLGQYLRRSDPPAAFKWVLAAAERDRAPAMRQVGLLYSNGAGVPRDLAKAATWFTRASDRDDIPAKTMLAECYLSGKGVAKDEPKAVDLLKEAVEGSDARAMDMLANCYHKGIGVTKDSRAAFGLYDQAAKAGYLDAFGNLGVLYLTTDATDLGKDQRARMQKAVQLFQEGAQQNNAFCMYLFAQCLESGTGVAKSPSEALNWYRRSAEAGNRAALDWCQRNNIAVGQ